MRVQSKVIVTREIAAARLKKLMEQVNERGMVYTGSPNDLLTYAAKSLAYFQDKTQEQVRHQFQVDLKSLYDAGKVDRAKVAGGGYRYHAKCAPGGTALLYEAGQRHMMRLKTGLED